MNILDQKDIKSGKIWYKKMKTVRDSMEIDHFHLAPDGIRQRWISAEKQLSLYLSIFVLFNIFKSNFEMFQAEDTNKFFKLFYVL